MLRRLPGEHPGLFTDMYHPDSAYVSWVTGRNGITTFDLYGALATIVPDISLLFLAGSALFAVAGLLALTQKSIREAQ